MLSVSGNIFIPTTSQVKETKYKEGYFFSFIAVSKHPTQEKRVPHLVNVYVPSKNIDKAREYIKPGEMISIRHGDLNGKQPEGSNSIFSEVRTTWNNIEFLTRIPRKERQ